jgi:drug/metabolite transporter (DMT)-like permease
VKLQRKSNAMFLFYFSMSMVIFSVLLYHVFQKATSASVNPLLALAATFATATIICLALFLFSPRAVGLIESARQLNWASFALAFAVVGIDVGFLLAYRAGWSISISAIVANTLATLLLLPIGLLFFKEKLSLANIAGVLVCLLGLVMINKK